MSTGLVGATIVAIPDDATLARGVVAGDPRALAATYDRYAGRLLGFCHSLLRSQHDAEECLQDVFVVAATRLGELREPQLLRSWLFAIARDACLARVEQRAQQPVAAAEPVAAGAPEPVAVAEAVTDYLDPIDLFDEPASTANFDAELSALLDDGTDTLTRHDRLLLELADRQQLLDSEVADAIGLPRGRARNLIARARSAARTSMGAVLVARSPRGHCPQLDQLLTSWDGQVPSLPRKQVNAHIAQCESCSRQYDLVATPAALLGEGRAFAAEMVGLRSRILAHAARAAAAAAGAGFVPTADRGWIGGWPPADPAFHDDHPRRRWGAPIAVLVVLLLTLGAALALLANTGGGHSATSSSAVVSVLPSNSTPAAAAGAASAAASTDAAVVAPPAAVGTAPNSPVAAGSPVTSAPSPSPTATPGTTWTLSITTDQHPVVVVAKAAQANCAAHTSCSYPVPNGTVVTVADTAGGRIIGALTGPDTFSAPASCVGQRTGSCAFAMTANVTIKLTTTNVGRN